MSIKKGRLKPLLLSLVLTAVPFFVSFLTSGLYRGIADELRRECTGEAVFAAAAFLCSLAAGRGHIYRMDWNRLRDGWPSGLYILISFGMTMALCYAADIRIAVPTKEVMIFIVYMLLIGFGEEVLFRGIMQNAVHDYFGTDTVTQVRAAVIASGLFFGSIHLINALDIRIERYSVLVQVLGAAAMGMYLGAVSFRTGRSIWYCAALHALNNAAAFVAGGRLSGNSTSQVITLVHDKPGAAALIAPAICVFLTLYLLRPSKVTPLLHGEWGR